MVAHLLESVYDGDLLEAVREVYGRLEGHFTFVVIHHDEPDRLVGVRRETPMVIGLGNGENFLASNLSAFLSETRRVAYPNNGEIVEVTPGGVRMISAEDGSPIELEEIRIDWDEEVAEREGFETFMLKEIYEQPEGFEVTIGDRVRHGALVQDGLGMNEDELRSLRRIVIVACGTAYHAGVVGRYVIEEWGRLPVEPDIASEWIYRNPVIGPDTLVIGISQSGETRDTIQAMKLARELGARTVAITNQMGSQITREVDSVPLHAHRPRGRRRGVEDLLGSGRADVPDRPRARPRPRDAAARRDRVHPRRGLPAAAEDAGVPQPEPPDRRDRDEASTASPSSSSSAATSAFRSRWKAR